MTQAGSEMTVRLTDFERACFQQASHREAYRFYMALRCALLDEYEAHRPFHLQANAMAKARFIAGRRDRKFYLGMIKELRRLGLIELFEAAKPLPERQRRPALYRFGVGTEAHNPANLISLASYRRGAMRPETLGDP